MNYTSFSHVHFVHYFFFSYHILSTITSLNAPVHEKRYSPQRRKERRESVIIAPQEPEGTEKDIVPQYNFCYVMLKMVKSWWL